ncbi:MAG: hypothetical protein K2P99_05005 [Burkholderiales bacterium]|nr:hypothetical protein [Burkholderiales bacterium]
MKKILFLVAFFVTFNVSFADQSITIIGGNSISTPPIAIMNFANDNESVNNVANIIANDLNVSGDVKAINVTESTQIESKVNYVVYGNIKGQNISYQLKLNNESATVILTSTVNNFNKNIRMTAHTISNQIYQKLTNTPGIFTSKIAYIVSNKHRYKIIISDYDGFNQKTIISTKSILSSLAWNPNGSQIAYVSFEPGKPVIYVQNILKPQRYIVSAFSGSNSSPSFTDDGNQLVVTLTKDSGSQLYLIDNTKFTHDTYARAVFSNKFSTINTEADLAIKDMIVFTSDHDGGPQIFLSDIMGRMKPKRLTFNLGNYNTTARFSHDAQKITFIRRDSGTLRTYVQDLTTNSSYPVSIGTTLDISPSFAPNDKLILFSSDNTMYVVNSTGTTQTQLNEINSGQIIDQKWSNNFK